MYFLGGGGDIDVEISYDTLVIKSWLFSHKLLFANLVASLFLLC